MVGKLIILLAIVFSQFSFSQTVYKYGSPQLISLKPANSPITFEYDVFYYLPKILEGKKDFKVIVFLHGGGVSTSTRRDSRKVAQDYFKDLIAIANSLGVAVFVPSGSGLNWGGHAISFLKDLNQEIRTRLPVNPNAIALTGHSMGGMGITREYKWLVDEFSFFMPVAAGMEERFQLDENLLSLFNTTYYHYQGKNDHFQSFITRSKLQEKKIIELESELDMKSGFTLEFYNGGHNYNLSNYLSRLKTLLENHERNLYQKQLYGNFMQINFVGIDRWSNNNVYYKGPRSRYFWLKALKYNNKETGINFTANIKENLVTINIQDGVKVLRVYLDNKMIDLTSPIQIKINNKIVYDDVVAIKKDIESLKLDSGYNYDTYIDLSL